MSIIELQKQSILAYFGYLFQTRDIIHLAHLRTSSYAKHKALNKYYEDLIDLTDKLIESYQGEFGVQNIEIPASKYEDPIKRLSSLLDNTTKIGLSFKESDYLNILDEIKTTTKQTIYKLKYLQ